ncbi:MAG: hypothetical protein ABSG13_22315 [Bryobacteraceae bacterium]|jgi:hypothetical protein
MKTVQVAIQDPEYADPMRNLLSQDVRIHLVATPDVTLSGVIIVDAANLLKLPLLAKEQERLIVIVHKERDDLSALWDAGVRHVIFRGDSPRMTRGVVLGVELSLRWNASG